MAGPRSAEKLASQDAALLALLHRLAALNYVFAAPAPHTHRRVLRQAGRMGEGLADLLGWSLSCEPDSVDGTVLRLLEEAGCLRRRAGRVASEVRVARAAASLFLHSPFPVRGNAHVFFGPDSYRFVDFLRAELPMRGGRTLSILDIGAGSGVGGIFAASHVGARQVTLSDVNTAALRLARVNAAYAGVEAELLEADGVPQGAEVWDVIVANPPYIAASGLTYSDGGGDTGRELSLRWAEAAISGLPPGGRFLLYTGSPIGGRTDVLQARLREIARAGGCSFSYRELDPDVFPESLRAPAYAGVERIAAVGAVIGRPI